MLSKLAYLMLCRCVQLLVLLARGDTTRTWNSWSCATNSPLLRRQIARPKLQPADRALLAALSRALPRSRWSCFFVKPDTLLRWHGGWSPARGPTRTADQGDRHSTRRCSSSSSAWPPRTLGGAPSAFRGTVAAGRTGVGDRDWHHAAPSRTGSDAAADEHHLAGVTANPNAAWVAQQARNLLLRLEEQGRRVRFLIRDRDGKLCRAFDDVFRSEGAEVLVTPVQAPNANARAERWVRTVRAACLDWLLIVGRGASRTSAPGLRRPLQQASAASGAGAATTEPARPCTARQQGSARPRSSTRPARRAPP